MEVLCNSIFKKLVNRLEAILCTSDQLSKQRVEKRLACWGVMVPAKPPPSALSWVFGPDSGQVLLDGKPINRDRITIGYLPEERGLYPKKVILEQLIYFGMLKGMKKADAKASAEHWAAKMKMSDTLNRRLDTLSKGNQQKISW
jgi:energy-coupling factor transporter ATP-binding protein EcfA2